MILVAESKQIERKLNVLSTLKILLGKGLAARLIIDDLDIYIVAVSPYVNAVDLSDKIRVSFVIYAERYG